MTKHFEFPVPREPVRDADRSPARRCGGGQPAGTRTAGTLIPVHQIPELAPDERIAELRLRVESGAYARPGVVEQVARAMLQG